MIDRHWVQWLERPLTGLARRVPCSANTLSVVGFGFGLLAFGALWAGAYGWALVGIIVNRLFDGLDGYVARAGGGVGSKAGAFLDSSLDFLFYGLMVLGFGLSNEAFVLPALVLLMAFIGTGTSFLAFASVAGQVKLQSLAFPRKGIYYLGGLTEGFETIVFLVVSCVFPSWFPGLAYGFGALCGLTTGMRIFYGFQQLRQYD